MVMIPMPTSFTPNSVPKAATAQSRYGPLMQALMAKQAAMQKGAMPKVAGPMPQAPTDAGPMRSDEGIPLWMQLGPGPERDAAYAAFMRAQGGQPMQPAMQPAMQQPASGFAGFGRVLQDMGAQGNKPELPAMQQPVAPNMLPFAPTAPQPTPGFAGFGRVLQDMGAQGNKPELPAMQQPAITLPAMPVMPKPAIPQPVMPKPAMPQSAAPQLVAAPQPQFGPRMQALMAKQRAAASPVAAPQGMAMGGLMAKYYGGGMC